MTTPTGDGKQKGGCGPIASCVGIGFLILVLIGMCTPSKSSTGGGSSGKPKFGTDECRERMMAVARKYPGDISNYTPSEQHDIFTEMDDQCDESALTTTTTSYTTTSWSYTTTTWHYTR